MSTIVLITSPLSLGSDMNTLSTWLVNHTVKTTVSPGVACMIGCMSVHLFAREQIIGDGRTVQVASVALCGDVAARESEITFSAADVTCPRCLRLTLSRD